MSDSYLGATEGELLGAPLTRRLAAYSDQRRLFPHQGQLQLTPGTLVLGGWRVIRREAVADVRLTFTDAYRRSQAAGIRGNNASFGLFGDLGKPLVLDLHDDEPVYLLIGFRWFTGINQARRWAPLLRTWSGAEVPAPCRDALASLCPPRWRPRGLGAEAMAEFGAESVVVAEVVDERAPPGRIDVLRAWHHNARIGVDLENMSLDDDKVLGDSRPHVGGAGLNLERAFGDPRRPDQLRLLGPQAGGGEFRRFEAEGAQLFPRYRVAPGQRGEPFDCLPLCWRGQADHQVMPAAQVQGGLSVGTQAQDYHLAERPGR